MLGRLTDCLVRNKFLTEKIPNSLICQILENILSANTHILPRKDIATSILLLSQQRKLLRDFLREDKRGLFRFQKESAQYSSKELIRNYSLLVYKKRLPTLHTVPKNGHGLTKIFQQICLFTHLFEIANRKDMEKSKYFN